MTDLSRELQQRIQQAGTEGTAVRLIGGNSKSFYGNTVDGEPLELGKHSGIVTYEPSELVLTARSGTSLDEIEKLLATQDQQLAFEPPCFGGAATLGGAVASGLSGPARPWGGAPRDMVLGVRLLDGQGRIMRFGGEVMKNVAGYDISRLQAGAQGTLGILLEVSLKVLPRPTRQLTLMLEIDRSEALTRMRELCRQAVPLSGACYVKNRLYLRLAGNRSGVQAWQQRIGGESLAEHTTFWQRLKNHELDFFQSPDTLWRLSLPPATPRLECEQRSLLDWAGAQRWVYSDYPADRIRAEVEAVGGHVEVFRRGISETAPFQVLPPGLLALHRRLKARFDPRHILNPGRLFDV